jgi:hypothetical protein
MMLRGSRNLSGRGATREEIFELTKDQANCPLWYAERKKRLTASNFGRICKMTDRTDPKKLARDLLYRDIPPWVPAIRYGRDMEAVARKKYREKNGRVCPAGLLIHSSLTYLACSSDSYAPDSDKIIEIKCPYSVRDLTPVQAARSSNSFCSSYLPSTGQLRLKREHNYFYQIQGQLEIWNKEYCDFIIYTPSGIHVECIKRDRNFWESRMKPKLNAFYKNYYLPLLISEGREGDYTP